MRRIISLVTALCFLANSTAFAIDSRKVDTSNRGMHLAASLASGDIVGDRRLTLAEMILTAYLKRIDDYVGIFDHVDFFDNNRATQTSVRVAFEKVATHFKTLKRNAVQETAFAVSDGKPICVTLYYNKIMCIGGHRFFGDIFMIPASIEMSGKSIECRLLFSARRDAEGNHPIVSFTKEEYKRQEPYITKMAKRNELPKATGREPILGLSGIIKEGFNISRDPSEFHRGPSKALQSRYLKTVNDFLERLRTKNEDIKEIPVAIAISGIYEKEISGRLRPGDLGDFRHNFLAYLRRTDKENLKGLLDIFKKLGFVNYFVPHSVVHGLHLLIIERIRRDINPLYSEIKLETDEPTFEVLWAQYNHLVELIFAQYAPESPKAIEIARAVLHVYHAEEAEGGRLTHEELSDLSGRLTFLLGTAKLEDVDKARGLLKRINIALDDDGDSVIDMLCRTIELKMQGNNFRSPLLRTKEYQDAQKQNISKGNKKKVAIDFIAREFSEEELEFLIKTIENPALRKKLKVSYGKEEDALGIIERLRATLYNLGEKRTARRYPNKLPHNWQAGGLPTLRAALALKRTNQLIQPSSDILPKNISSTSPETEHPGKSPLGLLNAIVTTDADVKNGFTVSKCLGYYDGTIDDLGHEASAPIRKSAFALVRSDLYGKRFSLLNIGIVEPVGPKLNGEEQVFRLTEKGLRILSYVHNVTRSDNPNIEGLLVSLQNEDPYVRSEGLIVLEFVADKLLDDQLAQCRQEIPPLQTTNLFLNLQNKDPRTQAEALFTHKRVYDGLTDEQKVASKDIIAAIGKTSQRRKKPVKIYKEYRENPDAMWESIVRVYAMGENPKDMEGHFEVSDYLGWFEEAYPKVKSPTRGTVRFHLNRLIERGYLTKAMTGDNILTGQYRFTEEGRNRIAILRDMNIQPETFRMAMIAQNLFIRLMQKGFSYKKHGKNIYLTADFRQRVPKEYPLHNVKLPKGHPLSNCIVEITYSSDTDNGLGKLSFLRRSTGDLDYGDNVFFSPRNAEFFNGRSGSNNRQDTLKGSELLKDVIFDDSCRFSAIVSDGLAREVDSRYFNNTSWFWVVPETVSKTDLFKDAIKAHLSGATSTPGYFPQGHTRQEPASSHADPEVVEEIGFSDTSDETPQTLISFAIEGYDIREIIKNIRSVAKQAVENKQNRTEPAYRRYINDNTVRANPLKSLGKYDRTGGVAVDANIRLLVTEGVANGNARRECIANLVKCKSMLDSAIVPGSRAVERREEMDRNMVKIDIILLLCKHGVSLADMDDDTVEEIIELILTPPGSGASELANYPAVSKMFTRGKFPDIPDDMHRTLFSFMINSYNLRNALSDIVNTTKLYLIEAASGEPGAHQRHMEVNRAGPALPSRSLIHDGRLTVNANLYMLATEGTEVREECMSNLSACLSELNDALNREGKKREDYLSMKRNIFKIHIIFLLDVLGVSMPHMSDDDILDIIDIISIPPDEKTPLPEALRIVEQAEQLMKETSFDENPINTDRLGEALKKLYGEEFEFNFNHGFIFSERAAFGRRIGDNEYEPGLIRVLPQLASSEEVKVVVVARTPEQRRIINLINRGKPRIKQIMFYDSVSEVVQRTGARRYYYFRFNGEPDSDNPAVSTSILTTDKVSTIMQSLGMACRISEELLPGLEEVGRLYTQAATERSS